MVRNPFLFPGLILKYSFYLGEDESLFKAKAVNEVRAERDRATPAYVDEFLTPIPSIFRRNSHCVCVRAREHSPQQQRTCLR